MNFKRSIITLSIISVILLFTRCEKEDIIVNKEYQSFTDAIQDANAKKPDKPPGQDPTADNYATILPGGDISGEGYFEGYFPNGAFTLTLSTDHFDEYDAGTFTVTGYIGDIKTRLDDDAVRIMYTTKKKGENRLDLWYADGDTLKYFMIRQPNPSDAYDPDTNTLTFDGADCIVAIRDGTGEHYKDYTPASATVELSYKPIPEE